MCEELLVRNSSREAVKKFLLIASLGETTGPTSLFSRKPLTKTSGHCKVRYSAKISQKAKENIRSHTFLLLSFLHELDTTICNTTLLNRFFKMLETDQETY